MTTVRTSPDPVVPVLLYHSIARTGRAVDSHWQVRAEDFAADMAQVVATGRVPMTATGYASWLAGERRGAADPVLVTFDDGFADYADVALPILASLDVCSTIFVTSGYVGTPGMLSADGLRDLAVAGGLEIGAHSVSHPHLDTLRTADARREIAACRSALEDVIGASVTSFAYPHGSADRRVRTLTRVVGYRTAHAVKNALSHPRDDPFAVGRFTVTAGTAREEVRAVLHGTGAPLSWRGDRLRTRAYRLVRTARRVRTVRRTPAPGRPDPQRS